MPLLEADADVRHRRKARQAARRFELREAPDHRALLQQRRRVPLPALLDGPRQGGQAH